MPKQVEVDMQLDDERPPSPRREQQRLLEQASEALASKQKKAHVAQPQASGHRRIEPTRRPRHKGGRSPRGGREGPGLQPLTGSESEPEDL